MLQQIAEWTEQATFRYGMFLDGLRWQAERLMRSDPTNTARREEAILLCRDIARDFISREQTFLNDHTADVARAASAQVNKDVGSRKRTIDDRFAEFIFSAALYTTNALAAQVERDVSIVAQYLRIGSQRVDLYVRSGSTLRMAVSQVSQDNEQSPVFRFTDRMGRNYKSSKHVRDVYRHHLLSTYNEVYLDVAAEHGHEVLQIDHPDQNYRWFGKSVALVSGHDLPLYYDIREEVFHPSSNALLTLLET